jgi:hypothetical protein
VADDLEHGGGDVASSKKKKQCSKSSRQRQGVNSTACCMLPATMGPQQENQLDIVKACAAH